MTFETFVRSFLPISEMMTRSHLWHCPGRKEELQKEQGKSQTCPFPHNFPVLNIIK